MIIRDLWNAKDDKMEKFDIIIHTNVRYDIPDILYNLYNSQF